MIERSKAMGTSDRLWLSMLVDTMERISRPELRGVRCESWAVEALQAQLGQSPLPYANSSGSIYSFNN